MKYSGYVVVPPFNPIKVVSMTNKNSHTLKLRKTGGLNACLDDESIHLTENRVAIDRLIQGEIIIL